MEEIKDSENRQAFLVGKLLATSRASISGGKINEAEVMRELGVKFG